MRWVGLACLTAMVVIGGGCGEFDPPTDPARTAGPPAVEAIHPDDDGDIHARRVLRTEGNTGGNGCVDLGLEWLRKHQEPAGYWDCDGFDVLCEGERCTGPGRADRDVGVTALALLAFLGAGETDRTGHYCMTVWRGLRFLEQAQDADGCFTSRGRRRFIHDHAIASLAMAEAHGLTGNPVWKRSVQRAVHFIVECQSPGRAWDDDIFATAWVVQALKSARESNLRVPEKAFDGARIWLNKVTDPESEAQTAAGILTRILLGEDPKRSDVIKAGVERCLMSLPGSTDMRLLYFGKNALWEVGGKAWKTWNAAMKPALIDRQRMKGHQKGSWDPTGPGGRIQATAMAILCLEVWYRNAQPIPDK